MSHTSQPQAAAIFYFSSIVAIGMTTMALWILVLLKFISLSFLSAMGEECAGLLTAGQEIIASSSWNYPITAILASAVIFLLSRSIKCCARYLSAGHRYKRDKFSKAMSCPALPLINREPWASKLQILNSQDVIEAQTVGILKQRILISRGLIRSLSTEQLRAVLSHEDAHRKARHNLLIAIARPFVLCVFYLPSPAYAFTEMLNCLERVADRKAASWTGDPIIVADAILKVATTSAVRQGEEYGTCAHGGTDLSKRLDELVGNHETAKHRWWRSLTSVAIMIVALWGFASSALALGDFKQDEKVVCLYHHSAEDQNPHDSCPHADNGQIRD